MSQANKPPAIGARWSPNETFRLDSTGFEHTNPRLYVDADSVAMQRALLAPAAPRRGWQPSSVLLAAAIGVALAGWLFVHWST